MIKKFAEEFGVTLEKARKMVSRLMDLVVEEASGKTGRCFVGRNHFFKRVDKAARNFFNVRTKQLDTTEPASYIVYRKKIAG